MCFVAIYYLRSNTRLWDQMSVRCIEYKNALKTRPPEGVQTLDNTIHQISIREADCVIPWIDVYRVDSVIQRLNNQGRWNTP